MTRQDLVNKSIDKLNTVKEALELIEILEYDECIAVLTGTKNLPSEIHSALMRRGKEANGGKTTLALAREVEGSDGKMQTVTEWQYDEKEMTVKEYENMTLMKSVVEENTSGIVESVTQFQKDAVIDEYTQQLIEEGLI